MNGHSELLERSLDEKGGGAALLYRASNPKYETQRFCITVTDGSTGYTAWQGSSEEEARAVFERYKS